MYTCSLMNYANHLSGKSQSMFLSYASIRIVKQVQLLQCIAAWPITYMKIKFSVHHTASLCVIT